MKLTTALLLFTCFQVSAKVFSQTRITLKAQSIELKKALSLIERKSSYRFLYNDETVKAGTKVDVDATNTPVTEILDKLFANRLLSYKILENNLVVITGRDIEVTETKVSGKITSSTGEALQGVSVKVKGTSLGAQTDANGNFAITVPDNAVLVISYVGYTDQEVAVRGRNTISITMVASTQKMDEVVVIGYGTANKRDLTGSIVKIAGKEVADKPNTNPIASLQSKVAGLSVVNNGTPGMAPDIRIRGTVSIGNVHPLYVVDGIFNDNIDYINPNDIESIEVLKDPSSLAIFGVKGATGVIAITTKKAKIGQTIINFSTTFGLKKLVDKIKMANADQFKTLFAEERANATPPITDPYDYTGLTANTDWIDAVTRTGHFANNSLSISGSTDRNRFNLGLGYIADQGIIRHEEQDKLLLSFSDEFKVSKALKFGINVNSSRTKAPYDATGVLDAARKVVPMVSAGTRPFQVKNPYGTDTITENLYSGLNVDLQNSGVVNPLVQLENEYNKFRGVEFRNVGSAFAELTFLKNFDFKATWYADMSTVNRRTYTPIYYEYNPVLNIPVLATQKTKLAEEDDSYKKFQQDYIVNYKKSFGDHNFAATGGFTTYYSGVFQRFGSSSPSASGQPIPNDSRFWYVNNGFSDLSAAAASSNQNEYSTVSYLGRILYNYKSKYYLNGSYRDDGSSRLPFHKFQSFWAVGAAWDITKENFMLNQHIFDFLKLKASIGVLGNQTASELDGTPLNYPAYPLLVSGNGAVFGTNIHNAAQQQYLENPNLKWETVSAREIGIELSAFKNQLHAEVNYFNKTTNNLLTYVSRPTTGLQDELINGGSIRNWGEEFTASWSQQLSKDLSINVGGNITFLNNKVLSLSKDLPTGHLSRNFENNGEAESRTEPGLPIGYFYGYIEQGIFQSYADILKSPSQASLGAYGPGDIKFKDVNGDGKVDGSDRTKIGNPTPKFTYGGSVSVNWKRFNLGIDIGGVYGNQVFRNWGALESPFQRVNYAADKINRWHGPGTSNWVPILNAADRVNYVGSTYSVEDGSYLRIRNLQLGYNFGQSLLSGAKIKNLRIFVNVQNLKTWKHNSGYTPEFGGDATAFGYDNGGGAIPLIATGGLNVTF